MTTFDGDPDKRDIDEAATWYARMRRTDADAHRAAFRFWYSDDAHRRAFDALERDHDVMGLGKDTPTGRRRSGLQRASLRQRHPTAFVAVASLALIGIAGGVAVITTSRPPPGGVRSGALAYTTAIGQIRTISLADGSRLTLDTDTRVRTIFTAGSRSVRLERGRARFAVARDATRPFVVFAINGVVRATGTLFDVGIEPDRVRVALLRGSVTVSSRRDAVASQCALNAGQETTYGAAQMLATPRPQSPASNQWPAGMIAFDNTRLADAVASINRYHRSHLELGDPALGDLRVSGAFRSSDLVGFARVVATMFHLGLESDGSGRIVIDHRIAQKKN